MVHTGETMSYILTFLTFTYHDLIFTVFVFSIIVDTCNAGPVRAVVGLALNT